MALFWSHGSCTLGQEVPVVPEEQGSEALALLVWPWSPGWLSSWLPTPVLLGKPLASGMGGRVSQDGRRSWNDIQDTALTVGFHSQDHLSAPFFVKVLPGRPPPHLWSPFGPMQAQSAQGGSVPHLFLCCCETGSRHSQPLCGRTGGCLHRQAFSLSRLRARAQRQVIPASSSRRWWDEAVLRGLAVKDEFRGG